MLCTHILVGEIYQRGSRSAALFPRSLYISDSRTFDLIVLLNFFFSFLWRWCGGTGGRADVLWLSGVCSNRHQNSKISFTVLVPVTGYTLPPTALLIFLPTATGTWIVSADFSGCYRFVVFFFQREGMQRLFFLLKYFAWHIAL